MAAPANGNIAGDVQAQLPEGVTPLGVDELFGALQKMMMKKDATPDQCFQMMRKWGEMRRVTPQKKIILPEDVELAISKYREAQEDTPVRGPTPPAASPVAAASQGPAGAVGATGVAGVDTPSVSATASASASGAPASPAPPAAAPAAPVAPPAAGPPPLGAPESTSTAEGSTKRSAPRAAKPAAPLKRQRTKELREQQLREEQERQAEEDRLKRERAAPFLGLSLDEMREKRMQEVLREMDERLRETVVRTARALGNEPPSAQTLEAICGGEDARRGSAVGADTSDRRDAYLRAIHTVRESVSLPEGLDAELMPHQVDGLEWLVSVYANGLHGILADEMGLGKTIQTIAWLQWLKEVKGNKGPHLIVAPKSTLTNWEAEFKRFAPSYKAWLIVGTEEERSAFAKKLRKRVRDNKTTAFITNYEQIHRNDWLQDYDWQMIIIDEGHRMKNKNSVLHQTMTKMRCRTRMLLTGTPLQNNMSELWALLHYLMPDLWATTLDFEAWFRDPLSGVEGLNEYEVQLRPEDEQLLISRLHLMLSPFLLQRTKAQVMEQKLPPKVETTIRVPLSAWQSSAYQDLEKRTIRLLSGEDKVETASVNNALMQLRKIVLHPYLFSGGHRQLDPGLLKASGKVEVLDRMLIKLLRFGHKTLLFSQFTSVLDVLEAYLKWRGYKFARLDGQTPHEERRRQIKAFSENEGGLDVFLLSARAGGLGLNLQAADTVIIFDLDWNPQNDKQAIARAHRYGQQKEVRVFRLLTESPVERHMERRCNEKLDLEKKIMGAGMFNKGASQEQRADMLRNILGLGLAGEAAGADLSEDAARVAAGPAEDGTTPSTLNTLLARSEEELIAFQEIDAELLRPQDGADEALPVLVRAGRLMRTEEVPEGFRVEEAAESDD